MAEIARWKPESWNSGLIPSTEPDPNDPNNPYKLGNIGMRGVLGVGKGIETAVQGISGVVGNALASSDQGATDVSGAVSGSNLGRFGMPSSTDTGLQPITPLIPGTAATPGDLPRLDQTQPIVVPTVTSAAAPVVASVTPERGLTQTIYNSSSPSGAGSAFSQNYDYLAPKNPVVQQQGIRVAAPQAVEQSRMYSPGDTSDESFGGMFTQGLRMKRDRAYAGMNDAVTKNMLTQQAQGITAQGQALTAANEATRNQLTGRGQDIMAQGQQVNAANEAERNRIAGMRGEALTNLENIQGTAAQGGLDRQRAIDALINEHSKTTDPAAKQQLESQIHLMQGREPAKPLAPHFGTETNTDLTTSQVAVVPDPASPTGFRKIVPQLRPQEQLQALHGKMTEKQRELFNQGISKLQPGQSAEAIVLANDILRKKK